MERTVEPYYFDNLNTSIKSFNLPFIVKSDSFVYSIRNDLLDDKSSLKKDLKLTKNVDKPTKVDNSFKQRSNSLEPYFRPKISINYNIYDNAIVDDDSDEDMKNDDDDDDESDDNNVMYHKNVDKHLDNIDLPLFEKFDVRDDFDNNVKFDFYL